MKIKEGLYRQEDFWNYTKGDNQTEEKWQWHKNTLTNRLANVIWVSTPEDKINKGRQDNLPNTKGLTSSFSLIPKLFYRFNQSWRIIHHLTLLHCSGQWKMSLLKWMFIYLACSTGCRKQTKQNSLTMSSEYICT